MQTLPPNDRQYREQLERALYAPERATHITSESASARRNPSSVVLATLAFLASFGITQAFVDASRTANTPTEQVETQRLLIAPTETRPASQTSAYTIGLRTTHSTLTGIYDPTSLTASYYWAATLKNTTGRNQEAVFRIQLPQGATVSRATLWVNGVPQEAAFGSRAAVAQAYADVAYGPKQRDPLLVMMNADNTVTVKASPVPRDGSAMRIRLGITTPLEAMDNGTTRGELPRIVDSNTEYHGVVDYHIESTEALTANNALFKTSRLGGAYIAKANLNLSENRSIHIFSPRPKNVRSFATRATHSTSGLIQASLTKNPNSASSHMVLQKIRSSAAELFIGDENAAHRLSTLWAFSEANRLGRLGRVSEAEELGHVYRFVSPYTSAVVLENERDYTSHSLNRNRYDTLAYMPDTGAPAFDRATRHDSTSFTNEAPVLSGATNGTIAPQWTQSIVNQLNALNTYSPNSAPAGELEVISGVNTRGVVRAEPSIGIPARMHLAATITAAVGLLISFAILIHSFTKRVAPGRTRRLIIPVSIAILLAVLSINLPSWTDWIFLNAPEMFI